MLDALCQWRREAAMPTSSRSFWPEVVMLRPNEDFHSTFTLLQSCQVENDLTTYNCRDFCVSKHGDWKEVIQVQSCMACHLRQVRTEDGSTLLHHAASGNCAEVGPIRRNVLFKKPLTLKTNLRGSTTLSQAIPALIAAGVVHVPVVGQRHANG